MMRHLPIAVALTAMSPACAGATTFDVIFHGKALTPQIGPAGPTRLTIELNVPAVPSPGNCVQYTNPAYLKSFSDGVVTYKSLRKAGFTVVDSNGATPIFYLCTGAQPKPITTGAIFFDLVGPYSATQIESYFIEGETNTGPGNSSEVATCVIGARGCLSGSTLYTSAAPVASFRVRAVP